MSKDFKIVLGVIGFFVVIGGIVGVGWFYFLKPWQDYNAQLLKAEDDAAHKSRLLRKLRNDLAEMEKYRHVSLPANPFVARREYRRYLDNLLIESGIEVEFVSAGSTTSQAVVSKNRFSRKKEDPVYQTVRFEARGRCSKSNLIKLLDRFYRAPIMHKITRLTVEPADRKKRGADYLKANLTVEALIVDGAEKRSNNLLGVDERLLELDALIAMRAGPAGLALVPWALGPAGPFAERKLAKVHPDPDYSLFRSKNIFEGKRPVIPPTKPPEVPEGPPPLDMSKYTYIARIVLTEARREAFLYNRLTQRRTRLRESNLFGNFEIVDEAGEKLQFKGKVRRIGPREIYFEVIGPDEVFLDLNIEKGDVFKIELEQNVWDAMAFPVGNSELEKIGVKVAKQP